VSPFSFGLGSKAGFVGAGTDEKYLHMKHKHRFVMHDGNREKLGLHF
jgi:hypothetical protein